jgi:hypothetical protein
MFIKKYEKLMIMEKIKNLQMKKIIHQKSGLSEERDMIKKISKNVKKNN